MDRHMVVEFINSNISAQRKRVTNGFNIHCPMCTQYGQSRPDTKFRCGFRSFGDGSLAINCFNCSFKTRWTPGYMLTKKLKQFLISSGISNYQVQKLGFDVWKMSQTIEIDEDHIAPTYIDMNFEKHDLPKDAKPISEWANENCTDINFLNVVEYAYNRSPELIFKHNLYWSPDTKGKINRRLLVPFYFKDEIVGFTGRIIDKDGGSKYYNVTPRHFIVNNHFMFSKRETLIVVEGVLDALVIDALSLQGSTISDQQAKWLKDSGKRIIILPDKDKAGQHFIDSALKYDFDVSFPEWDLGIKDAFDAYSSYGKLWTIKSILDNATNNKIKINMLRKR